MRSGIWQACETFRTVASIGAELKEMAGSNPFLSNEELRHRDVTWLAQSHPAPSSPYSHTQPVN